MIELLATSAPSPDIISLTSAAFNGAEGLSMSGDIFFEYDYEVSGATQQLNFIISDTGDFNSDFQASAIPVVPLPPPGKTENEDYKWAIFVPNPTFIHGTPSGPNGDFQETIDITIQNVLSGGSISYEIIVDVAPAGPPPPKTNTPPTVEHYAGIEELHFGSPKQLTLGSDKDGDQITSTATLEPQFVEESRPTFCLFSLQIDNIYVGTFMTDGTELSLGVSGNELTMTESSAFAQWLSDSDVAFLQVDYTVFDGHTSQNSPATPGQPANDSVKVEVSGEGTIASASSELLIGAQGTGGEGLQLPSHVDQMVALAIGYLGGPADIATISSWAAQMYSSGLSLSQFAVSIATQSEVTAEYPFLADPQSAHLPEIASFINSVYENVFERAPTAAELTSAENGLTANLSNSQYVDTFILNLEVGAQGRDQATVTNLIAQTEDVLAIDQAYLAITRAPVSVSQAVTVVNGIIAGTQSETQFINGLLAQVADTTIPAVAVEASMYGQVGSSAEITNLVTNFLPTQIANATQNGANPLVYVCEQLGLMFSSSDENGGTGFANNFGPSNTAMPATAAGDAAFAAAAATAIFGSAATASTTNEILTFFTNWEATYTQNGIPGNPIPTTDQIDLAARGTAWGEAVAIALANNLGPLLGQTTSFLEDVAQGTAIYSETFSIQPTAAFFSFATADDIYQSALQRLPTNGEGTGAISLGATLGASAVIASVLDSPEAQFNVYPIVQNILLATGNTPTAAQLTGWVPFVESKGLLQGSAQTNPLLDQMAEAFVASTAFGDTYNGGTAVDPNAPITASIVSAVIKAATGIAATQTQINAWLSTGQTIDQVFVDFALGDQYSAFIQTAVQQYLTTVADTAIGGGGLGVVNATPNDNLTAAQVQGAYHAVLQRAPTSAEVNGALSIDGTIGNIGAVAALVDGTEAQQYVYPVTQVILLATGNFATGGQLAGWVPAVETGTSLNTMALAFVASSAFGNTYNNGMAVDPNAPITAGIVSAIIDAATGIAATQTQINAWLATGETIDQVFVSFALGDQYSGHIQGTVQAYLDATAINAAGLTTVDGVNATGALTLGTSATPLTGNGLTILGGSGSLVVASGNNDIITELNSSTAGGAITASGSNDIINLANGPTTLTLTGDLTGATTQNGTSTSGIAMTTLGNLLNAASDQIIFNNAATEVLAGATAVDVSAAGSSLAKALDIAAADAAASQAGGQIAAHSGVIAWFQLGGNTYIVEAINPTASAATHGALAATDEVIKILGTVNLSGESLAEHTLTL